MKEYKKYHIVFVRDSKAYVESFYTKARFKKAMSEAIKTCPLESIRAFKGEHVVISPRLTLRGL